VDFLDEGTHQVKSNMESADIIRVNAFL